MEAAIPRKKTKTIRFNSRAEVVDIEDSSDEENTNDATKEGAAFLRAINKEEKKQKKKATSESDEDSN